MDRQPSLVITDRRAVLTIDRPSTRNAIDRPTMRALHEVLDEVEDRCERDEVRVLAIRGGGDRVFISGGDLKELAAIRTEPDAREMATTMRGVLDRVAGLPVPTVAVLNGHAYGGGAEVALACDLRIAAADVRLAFKQVALAIMPAWGGVERLAALVGRSRSLDLLLTGRDLAAPEAAAAGLVNYVVERADFDDAVDRLLGDLGTVPPVAARGIKNLLDRVSPPTSPTTEELGVAAFAATWISDDHWDAVERQERRRREARARA